MTSSLKYILIIATMWISVARAQDPETELIKKYAENSFQSGDYEFALENYLKLYTGNKEDINLNFKLGVCYTHTNDNKTGGIPHLEYVVSHNNFPTDAFYYLGQSYLYAYRFTEAVEAFYEYKISGLNNNLISKANHMVITAYNALEFINAPRKVDFERLDSTINTSMNDFNPYYIADGERMFYSSDYRYVDELAVNIQDIYIAERKKNIWETAIFWPGNSVENEQVAGISVNDENLFIYSNGDYSTHDLSMAKVKKRDLERTKKDFPAEKINTRDFEHGATMNAEGNLIYFASDRPGGYGGFDIYTIKKDENDKWGEVENAGAAINTEFDEKFPNLSKTGTSLYFSSTGHGGIGGYDLFEAVYNPAENNWGIIKSLGIPINTPYDEMSISWEEEGRIGYIATNRKEGFGKLDIYRITISPDAQPTVIIGEIMVGTKSNSEPYSDAFNKVFVTLYDQYDNIYARYPVEGNTFFASIPPGKYKLEIYLNGSQNKYTEEIFIIETGEVAPMNGTYFIQP